MRVTVLLAHLASCCSGRKARFLCMCACCVCVSWSWWYDREGKGGGQREGAGRAKETQNKTTTVFSPLLLCYFKARLAHGFGIELPSLSLSTPSLSLLLCSWIVLRSVPVPRIEILLWLCVRVFCSWVGCLLGALRCVVCCVVLCFVFRAPKKKS